MISAVRLRFPRLLLLALTLADLGLVALSALGLQGVGLMIKILSLLLLALSASALLLLCREWFSPSYVEFGNQILTVKWNNWRLSGRRRRVELTPRKPKSLELELVEPSIVLYPVGPLHLSAMFLVRPLLSLLLPPYLAKIYFLDSRKLWELLATGRDSASVRFPACLWGTRRIKNVLKKSLE